ncbi:hypothetical protein [Actinoallomurus sp. NPDC052274]|uniref:hypothetical protein n=1 Tax=Actinoallomurus sp. NPDC052274 TaxID=3155420 RepID=UPI003445A177
MSFPGNMRVVQFTAPDIRRDGRLCVVFPAWAHRVTAPVMPRRGIDLFERVILGLSQAGVREPERIAARTNLHVRLCAYIVEQATQRKLLDKQGELTLLGRQALRTGSVAEETTWSVRYVFQSPEETGELWPRTADALIDAYVLRRTSQNVRLQLGTPGHPDVIDAVIIKPPPTSPESAQRRSYLGRPTIAQIVEVARLDRVAREAERVRAFERRERLASVAAPEDASASGVPRTASAVAEAPELHRVAFVDDPEPVLIVGFAEIGADGALIPHDPFGAGSNAMFRELLEHGIRVNEDLADRVQRAARQETADVQRRFNEAEADARALIESKLTTEFGREIRGHGDAFGLMIEVDLALLRGSQPDALERVAQASYRLHEEYFRRLAVAYPPRPDRLLATARSAELAKALIVEAGNRIGFDTVPELFTRLSNDAVNGVRRRQGNLYLKDAAPLCVVAAHDDGDHPLRRMAAERPDLLTALATLGRLRNRGAHGGRDAPATRDAQWCRELAAIAARGLIALR